MTRTRWAPYCKKHPKYNAIRLPRTACYDCWFKWFVDHGFIDL